MLVCIEPIISGHCDPNLIGVRDAFAQNFSERGEVGAALCVIRDGEVIVDLWGGWQDEALTKPWSQDTLVNFYSVGKAIVATLVLGLVDGGVLSLESRVADVWPEFAQGGKHEVTIRQALSHQAAVPAIRESLTDEDLFDWSTMTGALAATEAWWEVGERHVYHTNTYGLLVGEIVRRAAGKSAGMMLRSIADEIEADLWFGVPDEHQVRCGEVIWSPGKQADVGTLDTSTLEGDQLMNVLAHFNPPGFSSVGVVNTPAWRSAEIPSTNGHGTANGLAKFYAALLESDRIVSEAMLSEATRAQSTGPCPILGEDVTFGLGFVPTSTRRSFGPNPGAFGHFGTGGAVGFADPHVGIAFGYVMNHVVPRWQSSRNRALIESLYAGL